MARVAVIGGTGPEGRGLAARFALAGDHVVIGSRQAERAERAADELRAHVGNAATAIEISGAENSAAVSSADIVVLAMPFDGVEALLRPLAPALAGRLILDVVVPLRQANGVFTVMPISAGSAGELIQQIVPQASVVSGFKNLSAKELWDVTQVLHGDVLLCSDHPEATQQFVQRIARMPELRPVDAGALANSRTLESITALLRNVNRRYRVTTSIQILGLKL